MGRLTLGAILGGISVWEGLAAPSGGVGAGIPELTARLPGVPWALRHDWIILFLSLALVIDLLPRLVPWLAVGVLAEVVLGLLRTGGVTDVLVRDVGLLALALAVAWEGGPARLVERFALGIVLASFGIWELTAPSEWVGYLPAGLSAQLPAVLLVLGHGWVLFVLAGALILDAFPGVASWLALAVLVEVGVGLVLTSGVTPILVRDLGLVALALMGALEGAGRPAPEGSSPEGHPPGIAPALHSP